MSKILIIANPAAGGGGAKKIWPRVESLLRKRFKSFEVRWTTKPGEAEALALQAKPFDLMVAYGGDGTIHEVTNGLLHRQNPPPLGLLSVGTGSDLIKSLLIPTSLEKQIIRLVEGEEIKIDVAEIEYLKEKKKRYFVNIADLGLGPDVILRLVHSRAHWGRKMAYLVASLEAYRHRNVAKIRIVADGKEVWNDQALVVAVANGQMFGGGMKVAPNAKLNDGLLEVVCVKDLKGWEVPFVIPFLYTPYFHRLPQVKTFQATTVEIAADSPQQLEVDGELGGWLPLRVKVIPQALQVKR